MADPLQEYPSELNRLIAIIESNLHIVVRMEMTRDEAIEFKGRCARPLGLLNSKHGLRSEYEAKKVLGNARMREYLDKQP